MTDGEADGLDRPATDGYSRLESLPLHSTTLLSVLDEDGVIRYESPAIERIYGFEQAELVGENLADYVHPDDRAAVMDAFRTIVESPEDTVEAVEYRHEQADGTWRWIESVGSSEATPEGHYVVNSRDITEQKRRERELTRQNDRLEAFARIVSHDLRNPLAVAEGRLALAREDGDSEHLRAVERSHDRMRALIEDLLTLAREGDEVSSLEPTDLAETARRCWANVSSGDGTLEVRTDAVVRADESRLSQLLENLLRNAIEHAGANVTVTVGDLEGGFYVEDDGDGIPESDRDTVFETGYSTTSDGTGIGLGIVETVADAHDWTIRIVDGSEGGARFEVIGVDVDTDRT